VGPTTGLAEGSVPQVAGRAAAASRAAASMGCGRGGLQWATARCHEGIPVVVRIGVVVDGNCRPVVLDRQTAAQRVRRLPPRTGPGHDRAGRSRQEAAKVPAVWVHGPVRASLPAARDQNLLGPSSRVLSARRRRGRSLHISSLSDDADIGHFQVSTTPDQLLRIRGPGCAVTAQQTLSVRRDGQGRAVEVRRWPGNRRMTTAAVRPIEHGITGRRRPRHAAQGRVC